MSEPVKLPGIRASGERQATKAAEAMAEGDRVVVALQGDADSVTAGVSVKAGEHAEAFAEVEARKATKPRWSFGALFRW